MAEIIDERDILAAISAVLAYIFDFLNELFFVLAILIIIDYATGIVVSVLQGNWDKTVGVKGLVKKIGYMICIVLAALVDFSVAWITKRIGLQINSNGYCAIATMCYLVGIEGFSILDNLHKLGMPDIPFLSRAFKKIRDESERLGGADDKSSIK